jgi:TonB family protein
MIKSSHSSFTGRSSRAGRLGATLAAALFASMARSAAAQGGRTLCQDSLVTTGADSVTLAVTATLRAFDPQQRVPPELILFILHEITYRIRPPSPLSLSIYAGLAGSGSRSDSARLVHVVVNGMFGLTLHRDGRVTDSRTLSSTLNPNLDTRVIEAIRAVDSAGVLAPYVATLKHKSVEMRLRLQTARRAPDTSVVVFRLRAPVVGLTEQVGPDPGQDGPRYPTGLREANVEGDVLLQFVVDESGRPDLRTLIVPTATNTGFLKAVVDALPRMRFRPAHVAGCPLKMLVQLPFEFRLRRWP